MSERFRRQLVLDLPKPALPNADAGFDYLPQAAMGLGGLRAVGTNPQPAPVSRLVIQEQTGGWCLFRLDGGGGFVGDTWHPDEADAVRCACREFDVTADAFEVRP